MTILKKTEAMRLVSDNQNGRQNSESGKTNPCANGGAQQLDEQLVACQLCRICEYAVYVLFRTVLVRIQHHAHRIFLDVAAIVAWI